MDDLETTFTGGREAQISVIGSMLLDDKCVPLVLSRLTPGDFADGTCRATFTAIRKLAQEGRPVDPVTVIDAMQGGDRYVRWLYDAMDYTATAANVESYIEITRRGAVQYRIRELAHKLLECTDLEDMAHLVRQMASGLSATDRMPMMTGPERVADFHRRMTNPEKPRYLPWGIPVADRNVYAELGDMILLGGYASSGKTLLSILMAQTQAKAGYKVGYYSLETSPEKMTDRQLSALAKVPLRKIKTKDFSESEWARFAEAENFAATEGDFAIIDATGSTADDITAHAIGHGFQVIYVDYVQNLVVPGMRNTEDYAKVTTISQNLKIFARRTRTAVVALAQLTRPREETKSDPAMPTMHSFKGSGQLEQDADVAFVVYPCDRTTNDTNRLFRIAKNKEGRRPDPVELVFQGDIQTMVELEPAADYSLISKFSAEGRAIKSANRARAQQQYQEVKGGDRDNPWIRR